MVDTYRLDLFGSKLVGLSPTALALSQDERRLYVVCSAANAVVALCLKRPGIEAIIQQVRNGVVERVVVAKLDRLTRSIRDSLTSSTCALCVPLTAVGVRFMDLNRRFMDLHRLLDP